MKTNANCGATSAVGSWSEPMPGSGSFAACWCVMSICSPTTAPSSTSLAFGLLSGGIFETRSSNGIQTNRDAWGFNFQPKLLAQNIKSTIDVYNSERLRWLATKRTRGDIDSFVHNDPKRISWSAGLKQY